MFDALSALRAAVAGGMDTQPMPGVTKAPAPDADAVLDRLRLQAAIYGEACKSKVEDLVTPPADTVLAGDGEPRVVAEVLDRPVEMRTPDARIDETVQQPWGRWLDIRYSRSSRGLFVNWLAESQAFELWTEAHEAAAGLKPLCRPELVAPLRDRAAGMGIRAEWKVGDLVEIVGESEGRAPALVADGLRVGLVDKVAATDGTTAVLYHAADSAKMGLAWFRNGELRRRGPRVIGG